MGDRPEGHVPGEFLHIPGHSPVHRLPAHVKIVAAFLTIVLIVLTPPIPVWVFLAYAVVVVGVVALSGIGAGMVLRRMRVEIPFVAFAFLLPFVGQGQRIPVGPLEISEPGLLAAWNILAKATLALLVSVTLASTTSATDLVAGLQRLRVPELLVQIVSAMVRYVHVVTQEWSRMSRARAARGFSARGPRSWWVLGQSVGTLFIRSYERGERVHLAMVSRGYTGRMPVMATTPADPAQWVRALAVPAVIGAVALVSLLLVAGDPGVGAS